MDQLALIITSESLSVLVFVDAIFSAAPGCCLFDLFRQAAGLTRPVNPDKQVNVNIQLNGRVPALLILHVGISLL